MSRQVSPLFIPAAAAIATLIGCVSACSRSQMENDPVVTLQRALTCEPSQGCTPIGDQPVPIGGQSWRAADVGGGAASGWSGQSQYQGGKFTIAVTGKTAGIGPDYYAEPDEADQMRFVYTELTGNAEIIVRVSDLVG